MKDSASIGGLRGLQLVGADVGPICRCLGSIEGEGSPCKLPLPTSGYCRPTREPGLLLRNVN